MTVLELKSKFLHELAEKYPEKESLSFFFLLMDHTLGLTKINIALHPDKNIPQTEVDHLLSCLLELQQEKPIQYIIGETEFYGLTFNVDNNVLIPRPETEELVDWIIEDFRFRNSDFGFENSKFKTQNSKPQNLKILDIGTGSGCIAISLAKHLPNTEVYALDISKDALQIAKQNAELNMVNIHFIEEDILNPDVISSPSYSGKKSNLKFDIIVSNPPYVRELEKHEIQKNVLEHEPHVALFVDDKNPLLFYNRISDVAKNSLATDGKLYIEINQYLGKETVNLLQEKGFTNTELRKDLQGNDRMVKASF